MRTVVVISALMVQCCLSYLPVHLGSASWRRHHKMRLHGETPGDSGGTSSIAPKITDAPTPPSLSMDAATNKIVKTPEADCDPIDEYCATDSKTGESIRLTVEEKERIYLDAIQSYYFNGREILSAEQFDILKEDLQWNGSPVVVLNRREAQFVSAKSAYLKGEPTMSDDEFDKLKKELKEEKSKIAVSTEPKCFIDTGICTVTLQEDEFRNNLLNLPLGIVFTLLWTIVSYEVFVEFLDLYLNPLVILLIGALPIYGVTKVSTEAIFNDGKIVYGPCPSCGIENRVYFGGILGVDGFDDVASCKCKNCRVNYSVNRKTLRASTVPK